MNRCDPVISKEDYLRITTVPANLELLKQGKVVILLDSDMLSHGVSSPKKDVRYFLETTRVTKHLEDKNVPEVKPVDKDVGYVLMMENLRFIADSPELLPSEKGRIREIAGELKKIMSSGNYTIRVNGHTADVNKPNGQQTLSLQRAEAIVNALVGEGLNENLFTWYGYGGTMPIADNSTAEGRAANRRVEIIVSPEGTEIQRR
ncbi:MAG: OmpA family protein [Treponema sp.]|nr:OmpA family protein [Treponema sp.]